MRLEISGMLAIVPRISAREFLVVRTVSETLPRYSFRKFSRRRFGLTALRLERFQGQNSLNRHLLCKQLRDVSTPRLGLWEGTAELRRSAQHDRVHWHRIH